MKAVKPWHSVYVNNSVAKCPEHKKGLSFVSCYLFLVMNFSGFLNMEVIIFTLALGLAYYVASPWNRTPNHGTALPNG